MSMFCPVCGRSQRHTRQFGRWLSIHCQAIRRHCGNSLGPLFALLFPNSPSVHEASPSTLVGLGDKPVATPFLKVISETTA